MIGSVFFNVKDCKCVCYLVVEWVILILLIENIN